MMKALSLGLSGRNLGAEATRVWVFRCRRTHRKKGEGVIPKAGGRGSDPLHCAHRLAKREKMEIVNFNCSPPTIAGYPGGL